MPVIITQGTAYGKLPNAPRTIMVRMSARDFYNVDSNTPHPNIVAHPDAFDMNRPNSTDFVAGLQVGYLGSMASIDLSTQMQQMGMRWLSSVYIDNSQGTGICILRHRPTGLQVTAQQSTQGHYPLLLSEGQQFSFDVAYIGNDADDVEYLPSFGSYPDVGNGAGAGGLFCGLPVESGFLRLQFTDILVPPCRWATRNMATGVWYDYSTVLDIIDGFVNILERNPFRKAFMIQNGHDVGTLIVGYHYSGLTVDVGNGMQLEPGQIFSEDGHPVHTGEVFAFSPDVNDLPVIVKEM